MEDQIKKLKADKDRLELRYEIKTRELQLRVRGLEEEEGGDVREKVVNIVAELLEESPAEVNKGVDKIFRLKSYYASREKVPRDILVNVLSRRLKNDIIQQSMLASKGGFRASSPTKHKIMRSLSWPSAYVKVTGISLGTWGLVPVV